jgi:hypothetical protein
VQCDELIAGEADYADGSEQDCSKGEWCQRRSIGENGMRRRFGGVVNEANRSRSPFLKGKWCQRRPIGRRPLEIRLEVSLGKPEHPNNREDYAMIMAAGPATDGDLAEGVGFEPTGTCIPKLFKTLACGRSDGLARRSRVRRPMGPEGAARTSAPNIGGSGSARSTEQRL